MVQVREKLKKFGVLWMSLLTLTHPSPCPHCGGPSAPHVGTSLMDACLIRTIKKVKISN